MLRKRFLVADMLNLCAVNSLKYGKHAESECQMGVTHSKCCPIYGDSSTDGPKSAHFDI